MNIERIRTDAAGRDAVAKLNARLRAAGITATALSFFWAAPIGGTEKGWIIASGLAMKKTRRVRLGEVEALIERAKRTQAQLDAHRHRTEMETAVMAAAAAARHPAGRMVKHEATDGGVTGCPTDEDEAEWMEWRWADWAKRALARAEKGEDIHLACRDEIAHAKAQSNV
jgi:hypothetical protein